MFFGLIGFFLPNNPVMDLAFELIQIVEIVTPDLGSPLLLIESYFSK